MRAFDNQLTGNRPIRRTPEEKQKQLRQLKQQLEMLPARAQEVTRSAIKTKIAELEAELKAAAKPAQPTNDWARSERPRR
jgi:chaperonin cofactor prefoldin